MPASSPSTSATAAVLELVLKLGILFSHIVFAAVTFMSKTLWIVDTGATNHISNSLHRFSSYKPVHNLFMKLPNSQPIPVCYIGTIKLSDKIMLNNMLHVPYFHFNLISTNQLINTSNCFLVVLPSIC